jgi:enamine deaminase RidA (YjgF/YER057c/UK114 family)
VGDITRLGSEPPGPFEEAVGYSRVVRAGQHVWVAGCTSISEDGVVEGVTAGDQMAIALRTIIASLERVGATAADVVRTRIFTTDISRSDEIGRAHGDVFGAIRPVTAMYEVSGLIDPRMLIEVEADAYVAES